MADNAATVVTNTCVTPGHEAQFAGWQEEMSRLVSSFPGFVSAEVIPPFPPTQVDWVIIQRFKSRELLANWLTSSQRADMLTRIQPVLLGDDAINVFVGDGAPGPSTETTAVIMTKVAKDAEQDFLSWQHRLEAVQAKAPGYLGTEIQPPVPGFQEEWVTMLRFDSSEHLNDWLGSAQRQKFLDESQQFVERSIIRQARNGFANWFAFGAAREGMAPAWKNNYIVLLGLYPIVMLEILFLNPYLDWLDLPIGNFVGNIISVGVLGWPVIWLLSRWFAWWLNSNGPRNERRDVGGAVLILLIIAAMGLGFHFLDKAVAVTPVTSVGAFEAGMLIPLIWLAGTAVVFALWFSPLGLKAGIWGGDKHE